MMAVLPTGIEECLKPAVLEKTSTLGLPGLALEKQLYSAVLKKNNAQTNLKFFIWHHKIRSEKIA